MKHLTFTNMALHLTGLLEGRESARVIRHLEECKTCSAALENLLPAFSPFYSKKVNLPGELKTRIFRSFEAIKSGEKAAEPKPFLRRYGIPLALAALFFAALITGLLLYLPVNPPLAEIAGLRLRIGQGPVFVAGRPAADGLSLSAGQKISTPAGGFAELSAGNQVRIRILGGSELLVERLISDEKTASLILDLTLVRGTVVSDFRPGAVNISYSYKTPSAEIRPLGTEFLLKADESRTLLYVKSGSVKVVSRTSGETLVIPAESRALVRETIMHSPMQNEERDLYRSIEAMYGKKAFSDRPGQRLDEILKNAAPVRGTDPVSPARSDRSEQTAGGQQEEKIRERPRPAKDDGPDIRKRRVDRMETIRNRRR